MQNGWKKNISNRSREPVTEKDSHLPISGSNKARDQVEVPGFYGANPALGSGVADADDDYSKLLSRSLKQFFKPNTALLWAQPEIINRHCERPHWL